MRIWRDIDRRKKLPNLSPMAICLCLLRLKMEKQKIIAYMKPSCGWSEGVRAVMRKYDLPFEDRDIINDPAHRQEMIQKTGQMLQPCVEIDGQMLPTSAEKRSRPTCSPTISSRPTNARRSPHQSTLRKREQGRHHLSTRRNPCERLSAALVV